MKKKEVHCFDRISQFKKSKESGYVVIHLENGFPIVFSASEFPDIPHISRFYDLPVCRDKETTTTLYIDVKEVTT